MVSVNILRNIKTISNLMLPPTIFSIVLIKEIQSSWHHRSRFFLTQQFPTAALRVGHSDLFLKFPMIEFIPSLFDRVHALLGEISSFHWITMFLYLINGTTKGKNILLDLKADVWRQTACTVPSFHDQKLFIFYLFIDCLPHLLLSVSFIRTETFPPTSRTLPGTEQAANPYL